MVIYIEEKDGKQIVYSMGQPLPFENIKKLEGMTIKHIQFLDHKAMFTLK
jgi:hypothetical protein